MLNKPTARDASPPGEVRRILSISRRTHSTPWSSHRCGVCVCDWRKAYKGPSPLSLHRGQCIKPNACIKPRASPQGHQALAFRREGCYALIALTECTSMTEARRMNREACGYSGWSSACRSLRSALRGRWCAGLSERFRVSSVTRNRSGRWKENT